MRLIKIKNNLSLWLILLSFSAFSQDSLTSLYLARCQVVSQYYANLPFAKDAFRALAKIKNHSDLPTAYQIIDSLTTEPQGDVFWLYPITALYFYGYTELPETYKLKIRYALQNYTPLRGDTENHWCMYYASLYLFSEKEQDFIWFNGKNSSENQQESKEWLYQWMETTVTVGQGEFDSPLYAMFFIAPLTMLYEFAEDTLMKKRAEIMLYWLLADFFIDYLDGMYCGANSRIYEYDIFTKRKTLMSSLANFLLGDKPLQNPIPQLLLLAYSHFRLPNILYAIATDRSAPYENKERKRSRNRIRYTKERSPVVSKYTYMDKTFSLGSIQTGRTEEILQHSWQLNWKETTTGEITTLFGLHPYFSDNDMASLFPSLRKNVIAEVVSSKTSYDKEEKWVGASPYEKLLQYQNILIGLYDFSAKNILYKHYNIFFSKDLKKEISENNWIFCSHASVFVAFYPLKPYQFLKEEHGDRLRSSSEKNGFVLYAENPKNFASLEDFKKQVIHHFEIRYSEEQHALQIKVPTKVEILFAYADTRLVNGKKENPSSYPLFENPFLYSKVGSKKLIIRYKTLKMILDWQKGKIFP
jgi:hypothetical protein